MSDADIHRDLGGFEARLLALEVSVAHLQTSTDELKAVVQNLNGGWKTLMWLGGAIALVASTSLHLFDSLSKVLK